MAGHEANRGRNVLFSFLFLFVCLFFGYALSRFSRKQPQQCDNKKLVNESTYSAF